MGNLFTLKTNNITVSAQPEYMEYESSPIDGQYVWVYHIKIHNNIGHLQTSETPEVDYLMSF